MGLSIFRHFELQWEVKRSTQLPIRDIVKMYEMSAITFLVCTFESLGNPLHFGTPCHHDKWTNATSEPTFKGHVSKCMKEFKDEGENNVPRVAFRTAIVTRPLL